ncbi:putative bifunctional diguanylate cyclase/phosphodiesterase [Thiobacter aerophilum]|uniref:EAL domain-containing protein n=1 Tax=Thiobacter aerophilum TaxID=3121275 RepID=A0ABV0EDE8_9BURK
MALKWGSAPAATVVMARDPRFLPSPKGEPGRDSGQGISSGIVAGFLVVLVLLGALTVLALHAVTEANQRLERIAENHNVKTELATTMHNALRERALAMHAMPIITDAFEKDAMAQYFHAQGVVYMEARAKLQNMPLSQAEQTILARIAALTREAQPEVERVVDMATFTDDSDAIFERIRSVAMPRQRAIAREVNQLIELQREQTAKALAQARSSYQAVRTLLLALGTAAVLVGLTVAAFVSRRVAHQAGLLARQALYDPLTGLANRCLLQDRLSGEIAQAQRQSTSFGVVLLDLDHFKEVNDTLGHEVGDEVLREVARRLVGTVRGEDTVSRLGGDEYVLLLHGLAEKNAQVVALKILAALDRPFVWQGNLIDLGASLGVALYPAHGEDASSLIRCADIAMYAAKRSGRGWALYSTEQDRLGRADLSFRSELREAIRNDELVLHYQPKIDLHTRRVVGLEALVRWDHPVKGFLSPDRFILLAEQAGLIGALTEWVLERALRDLVRLHHDGHLLHAAVNLSARSLHDLGLPASIETLLARAGMAPDHLMLEITESAVMANPSDSLAILTELDRMGVRLAIDDFGTGYSSLAYLKRLPVDEVKIDKSFVLDLATNESDAVIVRSTIDLAHNLGLSVTAEGVETQDIWDTLTILGCDCAQGYHMARPMGLNALRQWLRTSPWAGGENAASQVLSP